MERVFVVTDSTADIPQPLVEELGITVVPLKIYFGEETYLDGKTITAEAFYNKLRKTRHLPITSPPSPLDFFHAYKAIADGHGEAKIISIHHSSAMSGTWQSASIAKEMLAGKADITVIDAKKASFATGLIVLSVAESAKAGRSKEYCLEKARYLVENTHVYFLVNTLKYLRKCGRIGIAASLLGTLLNVKPVLSLDPVGEVFFKEKVRGTREALSQIIERLIENARSYERIRLGISHAAAAELANLLGEELKERFKVDSVPLAEIGPASGAQVGPGTLAVTLSADDYDEGYQ